MASLYDEKVLGAKERIALARKLQEQGDNVAAGQMVSGWYVPNTGGAVLGALKNVLGAWEEKGAKEELDTAERDKNMALARGLMGTGMQIPDDLRSKLATPEQSPSWWERGKAFVTGDDQPQGTPRQEFTEQPVTNPTDAQREQAMMQLTTVDPAFAAPLIQQSQFKYSKEQEKQLRQDALAAQQEEHKAQREWREQESERDRIARQDLAKMNIQSREDLARLAASLRAPSGGNDGGVAKGWEVITNPNTGLPSARVNKLTGEVAPLDQSAFGAPKNKQTTLNESQSNAYLFGTRAGQANETLKANPTANTAAISTTNLLSNIPVVGGIAGAVANSLLSDKSQEVKNAQKNFLTSVLRKESGASISPSEFAEASKIYFPQVGDKPEVLKQKEQNRQMAIQGIISAVPQDYLQQHQQAQPAQPQQGGWAIRPKGQ